MQSQTLRKANDDTRHHVDPEHTCFCFHTLFARLRRTRTQDNAQHARLAEARAPKHNPTPSRQHMPKVNNNDAAPNESLGKSPRTHDAIAMHTCIPTNAVLPPRTSRARSHPTPRAQSPIPGNAPGIRREPPHDHGNERWAPHPDWQRSKKAHTSPNRDEPKPTPRRRTKATARAAIKHTGYRATTAKTSGTT